MPQQSEMELTALKFPDFFGIGAGEGLPKGEVYE